MAFKIDTQMQVPTHNSTPQKPKPNPKPESAPNPNNSRQIHTKASYPSQNLIDKYKTPSAFINTQNAMSNQLGIQSVIKPQEQVIAKDALLEFLSQIRQLSFEESLELEKTLLRLDSNTLAELLKRIQQ
ncbi:hypothetical protein [Helicobacter sp.]|uniref:hypothetical protein n=1 Tax=Helicobacter sp. TaxID=218 RepID=UPI0025C2B6BC|nr:hypothetical protein [Helicobacter sp.]MCI5968823.1 hypothetical protein [Helicobacter sp.]MDY2584982.1 hypothetical protein [Helicobacter sp.]